MRTIMLAVTGLLLAGALIAPVVGAAEPCAHPTIRAVRGQVTIGTDGPDVIRGTEFNDMIDGQGGNDIICGRGGRDQLYGGLDDGDDRLYGGPGNDYLVGFQGDDDLFGQGGDDVLYAGLDEPVDYVDRCDGGSGNDREYYLPTCDTYHGMEHPLA